MIIVQENMFNVHSEAEQFSKNVISHTNSILNEYTLYIKKFSENV